MKTKIILFRSFLFCIFVSILFAGVSCNRDRLDRKGTTGTLSLKFADETLPALRSLSEPLDTNSFRLTVTDSRGRAVYDGAYADIPESFQLVEDTYQISAVSCEFTRPRFSAPQYGDEKYVVVRKGEDQRVVLECKQMNAGVILHIDRNFLSAFQDGALLLRSDAGSLMYGYREKRAAYFHPGNVSLILSRGGLDKVILSRRLKARDMLDIVVSATQSSPASDGIILDIDTTRNWIREQIDLGNGGSNTEPEEGDSTGPEDNSDLKGHTPYNAFTIAEAARNVGLEGVWVHGFISGGDLTSSSSSSEPPFKSASNLLLAPRAGKCSRNSCLAVSLPEGKVRDALNLVTHPELLGKPVSIKGNLVEPYFRLVGLKVPVDYRL